MKAVTLSADGKLPRSAVAFACGLCARVHLTEREAHECCRCVTCGEALRPDDYSEHAACASRRREQEREALRGFHATLDTVPANAERRPGRAHRGPVATGTDGLFTYYPTLRSLLARTHRVGLDRPAWVWGVEAHPFGISAEALVEDQLAAHGFLDNSGVASGAVGSKKTERLDLVPLQREIDRVVQRLRVPSAQRVNAQLVVLVPRHRKAV